jgi:hypothetical protein
MFLHIDSIFKVMSKNELSQGKCLIQLSCQYHSFLIIILDKSCITKVVL